MMTRSADHWNSGATYDEFMGRWSRMLAPQFVAWLEAAPRQHWLEVGCGTGSLTAALCTHAQPESVTACDPSPAFIEYARANVNEPQVQFVVATADDFPLRPGGYDVIASLLALNFFPSAASALERMRSAVRSHGTVAACVWDYAGEMQFLRCFWDAAKKFGGGPLDEGERFPICHPGALTEAFSRAGLERVECAALEITTTFRGFDDYWQPLLGGTGPAPSFLSSLDESQLAALRSDLEHSLPTDAAGAISLRARAWAVRGQRAA